jgi:hypothetical protein
MPYKPVGKRDIVEDSEDKTSGEVAFIVKSLRVALK